MCHPSVPCKSLDFPGFLASNQIISLFCDILFVTDVTVSTERLSEYAEEHTLERNLQPTDTGLMSLFHLFEVHFNEF